MIYSDEFFKLLKKKKINFFTGVPDSVLKFFLEKVSQLKKENHVETFNEGSAISLAISEKVAVPLSAATTK